MKKMMAAACLGLALATTCMAVPAMATEKEATTPSGRAEMVFAYTSAADTLTAIQSKCMDNGWMITSQVGTQVICEVPMGMWQSVFTQMLIGNSYSTEPKQFVRFSVAQVGEHTRVQTQVWAETQMAFGQVQHHQYTDDGTYNNMLTFMGQAGGQFPVGTTFTSRAYLGVDGADATALNGRRSTYAYRLTSVYEPAPGYRLGLRTGDLVTKVNNRTFRNAEAFGEQLNRQTVGRSLTVTVVRDGVEQTFSTTAEGRPPIAILVRPGDVPGGQTPVSVQMAAALYGSVPDAIAMIGGSAPNVSETPPETIAVASQQPDVAPAAESELDRARREAAEAQARLAAAEAAAAEPVP